MSEDLGSPNAGQQTWRDFDNKILFDPLCGVIRDRTEQFIKNHGRLPFRSEFDAIAEAAIEDAVDFVSQLDDEELRKFADIIDKGEKLVDLLGALDEREILDKSDRLHSILFERDLPHTLYHSYCTRTPAIREAADEVYKNADEVLYPRFSNFHLLVRSDGELEFRTGSEAIMPLLKGMRFVGFPGPRQTDKEVLDNALANITGAINKFKHR